MTLFGISTSALAEKPRFDQLLAFEPEVIEFYNYPSSELPRIEAFCRNNGIKLALHTPTPYDAIEPLRRFAPTGPDPAEFSRALRMTLDTIRAASRLNALHVVVHFPTPYADAGSIIDDETIDAFMRPVSNEARELGVRLLVENLSSHPTFHKPEHYEALLDRYNELEFCLDLGHAAQLGQIAIADFVTRLGPRIRSAHIYNWRKASGRAHVPVSASQLASEGWIDLVDAVTRLRNNCKIASWILEPDPLEIQDFEEAQAGARWLRSQLGKLEDL